MRLIEYIDQVQATGVLWFTKEQALDQLGCTKIALKRAIDKLKEKRRILVLRSKFVLIIPPEYRDWGIVPAEWFIDPLMKELKIPYYIALLSAGQFYGAAHQKPMQFQVMTNQQIRDIKYGRIHIRFIEYSKMTNVPTKRTLVKTGYVQVSTPEVTALDMCKYYRASGYWSNIATVIAELLESIDIDELCKLTTSGIYEMPVIQRLGFVLSHPDVKGNTAAEAIYKVVKSNNFRWVPLNPRQKFEEIIRDDKWKIFINEEIEADI